MEKGEGRRIVRSREFRQFLSKGISYRNQSLIPFHFRQLWRMRSLELLPFQDNDSGSSVNELGLTNVGGIFLVLLVGVVCSVAIAVAEKGFGSR